MKLFERLFSCCAAILIVLGTLPAFASHTHQFQGTYEFDLEANSEAAAHGLKTSIHDLFTGPYEFYHEFSHGGYLYIAFDVEMDFRGNLIGSGLVEYEEPGLFYQGNCTVKGKAKGRIGSATALFTRASFQFQSTGLSYYNDGFNEFNNVPTTFKMTSRLVGDYVGSPENPDNFLFGVSTFKLALSNIGSVKYSKVPTSFWLPVPVYDPGTWVMETEVFQHGNSISGTAWIYLDNDRVLTFHLSGYYSSRYQEYVYFLDGVGPGSQGNFLDFVETFDPMGYSISFMRGRILKNLIIY